ncbi:FxsC protein [Streptomyces sp. S.PB5]|uniref:FxsC protein n=1 Tax=Streptomyces sp. S.PB5 TaxID=3020844 RepID=UPI0025B21520|nr:FxsC protein [Streptomyces sp. S.PB5]MDN3025846.1 FxsC protein [Streptomyces sp. S.PB5]
MTAPVFFLSHARTPGSRMFGPDPDRPVFEFFDDLARETARAMEVPEATTGFVERSRATPHESQRALATCQVFVPLYSPRYFTDPVCGRQWTAFRRRAGATYPGAVVPVLWTPRRAAAALPLAVLDVPVELGPPEPHEEPAAAAHEKERYEDGGLYQLMDVDDDRQIYQRILGRLARRIAAAARTSPAPPVHPSEVAEVADAFAVPPPRPVLRLTVLAPQADRLPPGRDADAYGPLPADWRPYRSGGEAPVAAQMAEVARNLGFSPEAVPFEKAYGEFVSPGPGPAPWVLAIDAWALTDPRLAERVRDIDEAGRPWVAMLAVLAVQEEQTRQNAARLRALLRSALPRHLDAGRNAQRAAARGIETADAFGLIFAELAQGSYMRYVGGIQEHTPARRSWPNQDDDSETGE